MPYSKSIIKKCAAMSASGLAWATIQDEYMAAAHHELVLSKTAVARLNDLSPEEEAACWDFAFERADNTLRTGLASAVGIVVNDGPPAGQTVGHVHLHVLGFSAEKSRVNLPVELDTLAQKFAITSKPRPLKESVLSLTDTFSTDLRAARRAMTSNDKETGFSIFTTTPARSFGPHSGVSFALQCWSAMEPRDFGVTNLIRVINGYRDTPYVWSKEHLQRTFAIAPAAQI